MTLMAFHRDDVQISNYSPPIPLKMTSCTSLDRQPNLNQPWNPPDEMHNYGLSLVTYM